MRMRKTGAVMQKAKAVSHASTLPLPGTDKEIVDWLMVNSDFFLIWREMRVGEEPALLLRLLTESHSASHSGTSLSCSRSTQCSIQWNHIPTVAARYQFREQLQFRTNLLQSWENRSPWLRHLILKYATLTLTVIFMCNVLVVLSRSFF